MRADGARVGVGELLAAHRALAAVDPSSHEQAYFALRATLCSRREDLDAFDAAFELCFGQGLAVPSSAPAQPAVEALGRVGQARPRAAVPDERALGAALAERERPVPAAWSAVELLRDKDFAEYNDQERALARRIVVQLARRGPQHRSRRTRACRRRRGETHDLRRTIRASLRYGGEPFERHWRSRTWQTRPLVFVCDVSGSMDPYARMLMQYLHAAVTASRRVEAFVCGTRLTRITAELAIRDPDVALARAARAVGDWSGGTRLGEALGQLNREHGRRLGRGAVVVVLSDGWDRGDPGVLSAEMMRLRRSAHAVVWLNPLKATPDYEPLARGMQAALPHVDHFLAGHSLASLDELAGLFEEVL